MVRRRVLGTEPVGEVRVSQEAGVLAAKETPAPEAERRMDWGAGSAPTVVERLSSLAEAATWGRTMAGSTLRVRVCSRLTFRPKACPVAWRRRVMAGGVAGAVRRRLARVVAPGARGGPSVAPTGGADPLAMARRGEKRLRPPGLVREQAMSKAVEASVPQIQRFWLKPLQ
jgi:hypothetical protein